MTDDFMTPPWGFSQDLLQIREPDNRQVVSFQTERGERSQTEAREFRTPDGAVLMIDILAGGLPEDSAAVAFQAWSLFGSPVPFRTVWHSYESWGDSYEEDVWQTDQHGRPVIETSPAGGERFVLHHTADSADELMLSLSGAL